jgi:hypothetical protein
MNKKQLNQSGALHLGGILLITLVIAAVGFVGARVVNQSKAGSNGIENGLAILNNQGDAWSKQTGVTQKFFWPSDTNCERKDNQAATMSGGVFGNNGKQVIYLLSKHVSGEPKLYLCSAPIDKPQTARVLTKLANNLMTTYIESGYEYYKNPIITATGKIAFEQRLSGETKSTYRFFNPSNDNLRDLNSFGQSMGYQWKAASDTKIITYRTVHPFNKCVYDITTEKSDCVETTLPKETVQVLMPRSNNYILYATKTVKDGKTVGAIYKSDLNGGNKKLLRDNSEVLRLLSLSPSETKVLFNENYNLKELTLGNGNVAKISGAQEFAIWQPIPPTITP